MLAFLRRHAPLLPWLFFPLASILFYSIPLFSRNATIHWDLADATYPAQKFLADSLHAWTLPHWTPYLESGIPFLADPRSGAWYPLHWLFFAIGITPRTLLWELAVHSLVALAGAYLLAKRLFEARGAAMLGAVLYAFNGFFTAHSSLLGAFEAAALLPWLLWGALKALDAESGLRWTSFTALMGGGIVLAGDVSASLESLLVLILVALATRKWKRCATLIPTVVIFAAMLGAIQILPALELHSEAHSASNPARFHIGALGTLVSADYYTLISGLYSGPDDPRQFYLYGGLLLLPLAISGFARRQHWMVLAAMIAPMIVFDACLRPPGDAWFAAALGLAMAAASGAIWIEQRMQRPHVWAALLVLSLIDLWFWNLYKNPLVFARAAFADIYGKPPAQSKREPLERIWSPYPPLGLGPADEPLIAHTETTYGTGLGDLDRYAAYMAAVEKNTKLLNGLGATKFLFGRGRVVDNPNALGRVSAPSKAEFVTDRTAALKALDTLDPAQTAVIEAPERNFTPGIESLSVMAYSGDSYRIKYSATSESLVRIAVPYYPGWVADVDGMTTDIIPVDEALMGVFVPAGEHQLALRFEPKGFRLNVSLSAAAAIALVVGLILA